MPLPVTRTETDSFGPIEVPADAYWGAQTQRSIENFPFGEREHMPIEIIHALAIVKQAAARVNREHTATQYALLSSLVNLPGKVLGFFAGGIAMATGYGMYFVITVLALLPAMLVYALLTPQLRSRGES